MGTDALTVLFYLICAVQVTRQKISQNPLDLAPLEEINTGQILGKTLTVLNKKVDAFLGIPYGESTEGEQRFKKPVAKASWAESGKIFNATEYGYGCWQLPDEAFPGFEGTEMWNPNVFLGEDCLNLNVWVPNPRPTNSPVLVWIYGGSFWYGVASLELYDGKFLAAEEQLIVVSMNYRVGAFGFLSMGTDDAPGNQGLWDQALALQWVKDNIAAFGGDPDQVTLMSESAGSASVSFHMLSPHSRPLFKRAALQSAAPTCPWAYYDQEETLRRAKELASALDCLEDDTGCEMPINDIVSCLRNREPTDILANSWITMEFLDFPWTPVVDGTFLPEDPRLALERHAFKDCEMLIGSNSNEAFFFIIYEFLSLQYFDKDGPGLLSNTDYMASLKHLFPRANSFGIDAIAFQYRPWLSPNDGAMLRDAVDAAVGDYAFTCPTVDFATAYAKADNPVYYYRFTERASNSPFAEWFGVLHGDEIAYIFGIPLDPEYGYSDREKLFSRKLMRYWANFARTG